jgi:TRAP transporter TAXI family solute receptor
MTQKYPFLAGVKVPANTYKGQTADVSTVAVNAVLIAGSQLKDDMVYNLTKALFENQAELAAAHAKGKELNAQYAVQGVSIPFHPGAVKYFKEKGLMK